MVAEDTRSNSWFERNAWRVFTGISLVVVVFGLGDIVSGGSSFELGEAVLFNRLTGTTWNDLQAAHPGAANLIDYQWRVGGAGLLISGLLSLAICVTAFRRGERWAWYAMGVWPIGVAVILALLASAMQGEGTEIPVPIFSGAITIVISGVTLALSARRYLRNA
jgi:hypothetical protein